ncbi:cleavage stimulation factor subunit 1-like [Varroa jacobsoni]|uniref:Cleavage stimulation factor subunit 1 n=1 Tax=Varroa destructor TaxID=109461 RepID=A0A7M7JJ27_VARDE|nr:cleavage stimulation factor subunit 1-like isoform X1 [Varroa destructor]XP_022696918.1 cleavage stimulation factor subunit 1-like [Varroa jacobsoni]
MIQPQRGAAPTIRDRDQLYSLVISQLFYDGHQDLAVQLVAAVKLSSACPPSDRLQHVVRLGLQAEADQKGHQLLTGCGPQELYSLGPGLDLEFETESSLMVPEPAQYETIYVTSHKAQCRAGAFNADGTLIATGSVDASIKVLDVERMLVKSAAAPGEGANDTIQQQMETHPVIRTLYDHIEEVTCLAFHPREQILVSGSRDYTIKIFDYSKPSAKRAHKTIQEAEHVHHVAFHPSGDYMLAAVNHPVVRLYDMNTSQCFVSSVPDDQHTAIVNMVSWAKNGHMFASCSADGAIKVWDGVSNKCVCTFSAAHEGAEVCSVQFSRNGKYVLSSGKDSLVKLWELSMSRCLIAYTGAGATGKQDYCSQTVFNHTEDYILFPDEKTLSLCSWDSRNAERQQLLSLGHNSTVRYFCHSPTKPAFLTCSDDYRARYWFRRTDITNK